MKTKWKFEKEFREAHPETIGETDREFDLNNYKDFLEQQLVNKNALLQRVSNCKADVQLTKIEDELGILQDIHGEIVKEYETYDKNTQGFGFKNGAVSRIRLDRYGKSNT